jgi:hypothetical protein
MHISFREHVVPRDMKKQELVSYVTAVHDVLNLSFDILNQIKLLLHPKKLQ